MVMRSVPAVDGRHRRCATGPSGAATGGNVRVGFDRHAGHDGHLGQPALALLARRQGESGQRHVEERFGALADALGEIGQPGHEMLLEKARRLALFAAFQQQRHELQLVGDVVIGEAVAPHDVDVTAFGYAIGQVPQLPARFESAPTLIAVAAEAAAAFEGAAVHRGLIVSGDQFVHSSDKVAQIRRDFAGVQVVEMEAAAIAQACAQLEVPFVVVRAVSDLADEKADVSFETFLETASVHSAQMVRSIIEAL